jgi:hypothetical protein
MGTPFQEVLMAVSLSQNHILVASPESVTQSGLFVDCSHLPYDKLMRVPIKVTIHSTPQAFSQEAMKPPRSPAWMEIQWMSRLLKNLAKF